MIDKDKFDTESVYCRMLGHQVLFSYCKVAKNGIACFKIMDCWFERLPISDYMKDNYTEDEIENILKKPENKVITLYELIEQAKRRIDNDHGRK